MIQRHLDEALSRKLMFEITESIVAEDIDRVILIMNRLKKSNIRFSMDDFGTGYSSLSNQNRLPLDEIKIDRAFINALTHQDGDRAMVTTILKMASILKLSIVAEGVETEEQLEFLKHHDCPIFQGYYYSKPLPKDQFVAYYRSRQSSGEGVTVFSSPPPARLG